MTSSNITSSNQAGATAATAGDKSSASNSQSLSQSELRERAAAARAELASTLDAIEYKLNVPRQLRSTTQKVTLELRRLGREKPMALVGVAAGVATVAGTAVGTVVWASAKIFRRR